MRTPKEQDPFTISREGFHLYNNSDPKVDQQELKFKGAHASFSDFQKSYENRNHQKGHVWRKFAALPGALVTFLLEAPAHIAKSGFYYTKSLFTGEVDRIRSYSNLLKIGRDFEEGIGDLALLINDKAGCYLVYDAQFNKYVYDEVVHDIEHPPEDKGAFKDVPPEILSLIAEHADTPAFAAASSGISKDLQLGAEKTNLYEKQYQELIQELTWIEDYIDHIDFANRPALEKLQAVYDRLVDELEVAEKWSGPDISDHILSGLLDLYELDLEEHKALKKQVKSLPKNPNPTKLFFIIKKLDDTLENHNTKALHRSRGRGDVYRNGQPITRISKESIKQFLKKKSFFSTTTQIYLVDCPFFFIPKEIEQMKDHLEVLYIDSSKLSYLPKELGSLQKLKKLTLKNSRIKKPRQAIAQELLDREKQGTLKVKT